MIDALFGNAVPAALAGWLADSLIFGTLLAGLTWLVARFALRGRMPGLEAALWTIVLVKFLAPAGPPSPFSLPSLCERAMGEIRSARGSFLPVFDDEPAGVGIRVDQADAGISGTWRSFSGSLPSAVANVYVVSVLGLAAWRCRRYVRFCARCAALPPADRETEDLVRRVCARLGVRRVPTVRVSQDLPGPFLYGFHRPVLILTRRELVRPNELETVVVHEVTHLRRGDPYVRGLQGIAGTLLYFWPVVAWVNRRIHLTREQACDEWALRHGTLSPGEYARCLLEAALVPRPRRAAYGPLAMAGRVSHLERRIDMVLKLSTRPVNRPVVRWAAACLLIPWCGLVLAGAAGTREPLPSNADEAQKAVLVHAEQIVERIAKYPAADVNDDGQISLEERTAFLMALFALAPERALEKFPYAQDLRGRTLAREEVYDVVRGLSYRHDAAVKVKEAAGKESGLDPGQERLKEIELEMKRADLLATADVLDGQDALLADMRAEPDPLAVAKLYAAIVSIQQKKMVVGAPKEREQLLKMLQEAELRGDKEKVEKIQQKLEMINHQLEEHRHKLEEHRHKLEEHKCQQEGTAPK